MAEVLSTSSPLRTGLYKTSTSLFFTPSKLFEAQMTEVFDEIWPMVTALKMLRWQVKGYYEEYCIENNGRLSQKFVEKEDVANRPNLYRTCIEDTWEDSEYRIAKNLLTNIFACYEGWIENISYQVHHHRSEVWTFVQGEGLFVMDGKEQMVKTDDTVVIPVGHLHAIKAITPLTFIEVQSGNPLVEEDIERFEWKWSK